MGDIKNDFDFKFYHKNPRVLSKSKERELKGSMERVGDISGIVHNIRTDEIVSGNQRTKIIDFGSDSIEVVVEEKVDKTAQGTVGYGYVLWNGERFSYRQVDWDDETMEFAVLAANKMGGDWNKDMLSDFNIDNLLGAGFKTSELGFSREDEKVKNKDTEYVFSEELDRVSQYVVFRFNKDIDWIYLQSVLKLKSTYSKRQNGKPWSRGIGRVVDGIEGIRILKELSEDDLRKIFKK